MAGGEAAHPMVSERLDKYWTEGKGSQEIQWGLPGDFDRCVVAMHRVGVPSHMIPGHCSNLHRRATGANPGSAPAELAAKAAENKGK